MISFNYQAGKILCMRYVFPSRKTDDARRTDQELTTVLSKMTSSDEAISVRAVDFTSKSFPSQP